MTQVAREEGQAVGMQSFIPDHSHLKKNFPLLQEALTTPYTHPMLSQLILMLLPFHERSVSLLD